MEYPIIFLNSPLETLPDPATLAEVIVITALRHSIVKPIEIGGQNMGPFVRYYMRGLEGSDYPWCAGLVSTIVLQSFKTMNLMPKKFLYQMGCDALYSDAKKFGTLVKVPTPGCIFLSYNPSNPIDCVHTGIVVRVNISNGVIDTMEGNTNDSGSREGYEYIPRIRSLTNKYFISLVG
jgi:hypothetical protein